MNKQNLFDLGEVNNKINEFSENKAFREAYDYYNKLKKYLAETVLEQTDPVLYSKYYKNIVKLKFLTMSFMDDWRDIEELIKNHFETIFEIELYDLWNMIKINLLIVPVLEDRDKIKEEIKKILLECDRPVVDIKKYKNVAKLPVTVAEWLKDYIVNLGNKEVDNLKKIEYLTNGENINSLTKEDKGKVKILFDLYENLKYSSSSRKGFEEDIPMTINNKLYIFTGGEAEEIPSDVIDLIKKIKVEKIDNKNNRQAEELKQLAASYPPGSLERKAVEEEIEKVRSKK